MVGEIFADHSLEALFLQSDKAEGSFLKLWEFYGSFEARTL